MEEKLRESRKEKPHSIRRGKEALAGTEHKLIVRIPLVVKIRPIVVQPQTAAVPFEVEDVRVAIPICNI